MHIKTIRRAAIAVSLFSALPALALAGLVNSYQFNGNGNWSIDGVGSNNTPVGDLQAFVPVGATVQKAFLYSSMYSTSPVPSVDFDGTTISGGAWTDLGANGFMKAYRTDVTAQVAAKVGGGSASPFTFSVLSESPNGTIDGEVLAIVYSLPSEAVRTIAFLDGFSASAGDSTAINLATPLTAAQLANPAFSAQLSLGIGFGYQPSESANGQYSRVDVNGQRLTTAAGGYNDGGGFNGGLITVGGLGDDPSNPVDPLSTGNTDDELYNLVPFLTAGDTSIAINTLNPSSDDNIFFAAVNITAVGGVNQPPPDTTPSVPDGASTVVLLGVGLMSLAALRRKVRSA